VPTVSQSLEIPAPPEQVWAVATNWERYGEWNASHTGFPEGLPGAEPGSRFKEKITVMGMPGEASWTVAESTAPSRNVWNGEGPMGIRLGSTLELAPAAGGATMVTIEVSFDGGPLAGPLGDTVAQSAKKGAAESLEKLKALVA
jgi:uncharacterized protein YndB with AHSA1/START domain